MVDATGTRTFELDPRHEDWIRSHADVAGPIERPHPFPWSTVLRVPARDGVLWFKENIPPLAFEAAVTQVLARLRPDLMVELVAVDAAQGWLLMRDAGTRLRDASPTQRDWEQLLPLYAQLQLAAAPDASGLVAAGCPDRRVGILAPQFVRLVEAEADALTARELQLLRAHVRQVEAAGHELARLDVPETIQHDDFHEGNVFVRAGRYRILDWGDACVSHPFATLRIPFEGIAEDTNWDLARLRDAYLEPFSALAPLDDLRRAVSAAHVVAGVTRALKWAPIVAALEPPHRWEDVVRVRLRALLDSGPMRLRALLGG